MKKIHFLGIGGAGASAVAAIAQAQGYAVTGCDHQPFNEFTTHFDQHQLKTGHSPDHLEDTDILAVTPAIYSLDPNNPELVEAKKRGIKILTWQEFMGTYLEQDKFVIAICGTHGKSTTTAMVGQLLEDAGLDPTVEVGTIVPRWGKNYRVGKSKYFLTEADEFNNNYFATHPDIAIVTTIEMDHPEFFKDLEDYKSSFDQFLGQTKGTIVANMSDPNIGDVIKYVMKAHGTHVLDYSRSDFDLKLKIPGTYNLMNAQAAFQVGLLLGIDPQVIKQSLENFEGTGRRFEYIGEYNGSKVYSDFGHHPTEIKVTLEAAREKFKDKKLWVVFQPHMFSRTKYLFNEFIGVFKNLPADHIIITDIYPSREKDPGDMNSQMLVEAINKPNTTYYPVNQLTNQLINHVTDKDVVFFVGAGDTDKWAKELVKMHIYNSNTMNNLDKAKQLYSNKKILILGLGINQGGVGAAQFFAQAGAQVKVTDLKTKEELKDSIQQLKQYNNITYTLGKHKNEDIDWADIILRNPAIKPTNPYLMYAQEKGKQIEMDLSIFLTFISPSQVIGVTGTKGKSTTSTLIYMSLQSDPNLKVLLAGNIGKSMLDCIPVVDDKTFVVLELSSAQLQALDISKVSPKWAVITNIYPDHLNYHASMEEYIFTKRKIGEFQTETDFLFLNKKDQDTHTKDFLKGLKGTIIDFSAEDLPATFNPKLPGLHNKDNIACSVAVAKTFDLDTEKVLETLKKFEGVEFRLQLISDKKGIKIYNDTTATNPSAAIESIKSLPGSIVIAGGMNKGLSYIEMAKALDEYAKKVYFLEGDATEEIKLHMMAQDKIMGTYDTLQDLLNDILEEAASGDTILFSPGATSFNLFQNEFDRGRQFNQAVEKLIK